MSRAATVPSTFELTGDHARSTLRGTGRVRLLQDSFMRLRLADGFSHARASAFALVLLLVEGLIAVVGLAAATGSSGFGRRVSDVIESAAPGPAGKLLTGAVQQAQDTGGHHQYWPLALALLATVVTGTMAMGQFERACNRIYGVEVDRPSLRKYSRAFALAVTAGVAFALGIGLVVLGRPINNAIDDTWFNPVWDSLRWPVGVLLLIGATTLLLKWSPNRRQPGYSWLAYGAAASVLMIVLASLALAGFFGVSQTFGDTYGPLAGMIALLLWCLAVSVSGLFGVAVTAQLEAVRAEAHGAAS
ncbi:MAG TPA: YihY/virulence factor BrkB family protein [Actinomycetes bacterium]|nr:YihY/virulence factor BrkB family protein [Actinomycetes bacterium]